jgi:hypothetical protein
MNESTAATITEQPRRRGDPIARCVNDLLSANAHGPGNLDMPALRRLLEFPKPDADIVLRHVFDAINAGGREAAGYSGRVHNRQGCLLIVAFVIESLLWFCNARIASS